MTLALHALPLTARGEALDLTLGAQIQVGSKSFALERLRDREFGRHVGLDPKE